MTAFDPRPVDAAGALQRAIDVMDRLRSPGGCPWDAAQTHRSLTRYLLEEAYEVVEAIENGDPVLLREELGDLLLQVLFHARLAQEGPVGDSFGMAEVASDLVDKLVRRHPHVFAGAQAGDAADVNESWERQKIAEKSRTSAVDGVPLHQPALSLTSKLLSRAARAGIEAGLVDREPSVGKEADSGFTDTAVTSERDIGERLLAVVAEAVAAGIDAETALRGRAYVLREQIQAREITEPDSH